MSAFNYNVNLKKDKVNFRAGNKCINIEVLFSLSPQLQHYEPEYKSPAD